MERFDKLPIVLVTVLLPWFEPLPCRAQPATPPTATALQAPSQATSVPAPLARDAPEQTIPSPRKTEPLAPPPPPPERPDQVVELRAPPLEEGDLRFPINLATALRLADARPLIVAAAQAGSWVAEAQLDRAKVLWVPTLNVGFDYIRHDGFGPDLNRGINVPSGQNALGQNTPGSFGKPLAQDINFLYAGGGIIETVAMTDAIFTPLAARQNLNAKRWDIQTAKNNALLMTSTAYFNVHRWRGRYAGALDCVARGHKLVEEITILSKDLVPRVEIDRARNLLADLEQQATSARENWRVSSAQLTQVLRLDPRAVVEPLERDHLQVTLIDPARSLDDLIPIGLTNRPELASQQALVQAVLVRIRQEKLRPLLPSVLLNGFQTPNELLQFGGQGIGNGGKLNNWDFRDDFSPQLLWQAEGMGFGNLARIKEQRGMQSQALVELFRIQDGVAADVTRTQARLQSAAARILQAERELRSALINYNGNYQGLKQTKRFGNVLVQVFRPQEAVFALQLLKVAYDNYFATVADYNIAEFQMFRALGYPAREIANLRPPGEVIPVNTTRPGYLPPVGTGPPPATR